VALRVTCINKRGNHYDPHERIERIGGNGWLHSQSEAIGNIAINPQAYYVSAGGNEVYLTLGYHNGHPYVTTTADGSTQDNLLALPECS
jgi:hypothetical protein